MSHRLPLKRTKIVATIGPASNTPDKIDAVIKAGANGIRLNMSHGTHDTHADAMQLARRLSKKQHKPVAIIADLQGPKMRVGMLPDDGLPLIAGQQVNFALGAEYQEGGPIPIQHDFTKQVKPGQPLFLRDGMMEVSIDKVARGVVHGTVVRAGVLFSKQGINLPDTDLGGAILTEKDVADLEWAAANDIDYVALSFVQTARDVHNLRQRLHKLGRTDLRIIAKIETKVAIDPENLEAIVEATDALMVARGDLATETSTEQVPVLQQRMIALCRRYQKPVIVATQMLESMINTPQPTRAEVSDVANAVMQGADAVMLSGESAMGKYPIETIALMRRIITYTERHRADSLQSTDIKENSKRDALAAAAITLSERMSARILVAETSTGQTARNLSALRPDALIVIATDNERVHQQMAILWGGRSYIMRSAVGAGAEVMKILREEHNVSPGDVVVRCFGQKEGVSGSTDTIQLMRVA